MSSSINQVIIITDVPSGAYYHYCTQLVNGISEASDVKIRFIALFADTRKNINEDKLFLKQGLNTEILDKPTSSPLPRKIVFIWEMIRLWWSILSSRNAVVHVHTHTGSLFFDLAFMLMLKLSFARIARTVHEPSAGDRYSRARLLDDWVARVLLKMADVIIVHDEKSKNHIEQRYCINSNKMHTIPHGNYLIFSSFAPENFRKPLGNMETPITLLFHGIKRNKGIEVFIEAIHILEKRNAGYKVIISGQISKGDEDLEDKISGIENLVDLDARYLPSNLLWETFERSDVVIMPYIKGTTSGAIHLAFSFGRPVISSDLHCFDDLVIDGLTGYKVPAGDPVKLADMLEYISRQKEELSKMGKNAYELENSDKYNWNIIAKDTLAAYVS